MPYILLMEVFVSAMGSSRRRPQLLHLKLAMIRESLKITQADMARILVAAIKSHSGIKIESCRVTDYESRNREPDLLIMLAYVRLGRVQMESVVDDEVSLDQFREELSKELTYPVQRAGNKPVVLLNGSR
jgi:hypothetical protein